MFSAYTSIQLNVHSDRNKAVHFRMYSAGKNEKLLWIRTFIIHLV